MNDAKIRAKQDKNNIKNQMIQEMEEFSRELQAAKNNISSTQEIIIGTIRDRLESSVGTWEQSMALKSSQTHRLHPTHSPTFSLENSSPKHLSSTSPTHKEKERERETNSAAGSFHKHDSHSSLHSADSRILDTDPIAYLLSATGAVSMDALLTELQSSEEYIFRLLIN